MSPIAGHRPTARCTKDRQLGRPGRPMLAVLLGFCLAIAGLAVPAPSLAANCISASHKASLSQGAATPGSGSPATAFVFTVSYMDNADCTPSVSLIVDGLGTFAMSPSGPGSGGAVTYRVSRSLPAGTWTYSFLATSGTGVGQITMTLTAVTPSAISVTVAPPPPPTPPPPPPPTPPPTPVPTARATPKPTAEPTPSPAPQTSPGGTASAAPSPASTPAGTRTPGPTATSSPRPSDSAAIGGAGTAGDGGQGSDGPFGGLGGLLAFGAAAVQLAEGPYLPISSWVASCLLGLLMFAIVLRRRRDVDDAGSAFATAYPIAYGSTGQPEHDPIDGEPVDAEASIPRWRRPSVQAARQSRLATATVSPPVRFTTPPRSGDDRRVVGYRLVRVADSPDEVRSAELGRFDRGDEVEVLETAHNWTRVRGADGLEGWVLTETVASSVPDSSGVDQPGR